MPLILASGSPRRALLLSIAGITFTKVVPDVDEATIADEAPAEYVLRLSEMKAHAVERSPGDVVLAADTTVVLGGTIIGKPTDADDAVSILTRLSGETHSVLTGWTIMDGTGHRFGVEESLVRFNGRTHEELVGYIERTEPYDKAGAYALQGDDGWLVAEVNGSRSNVMGLPIREVVDALGDFGIERSPA
jgi:septum formation protein